MVKNLKIIRQFIRIKYKYRAQLKLLDKILKFHRAVMADKKGLIWNENDYFSKLTIICIVKNIHRLRSILLLCKQGQAKDTLPLLRTMFEELVDYKYIHEGLGSVEDYSDYDTNLKLKLAREIEKYKDKPFIKKELAEKTVKQLQREWDRVKHRFEITRGGRTSVYTRWNGKDLRETSKAVGLEEVYIYLYKYLSLFTHSTAISAHNYILGLDKKKSNVVFEVGSSENFIDPVCLTASSLSLEILEIANRKYTLDFTKKINELSDKIKMVKDKERIANKKSEINKSE